MIGAVGHCVMDRVYHSLKGQGYPQKPDDQWEKRVAAQIQAPRVKRSRALRHFASWVFVAMMILLDTPDWRSVL